MGENKLFLPDEPLTAGDIADTLSIARFLALLAGARRGAARLGEVVTPVHAIGGLLLSARAGDPPAGEAAARGRPDVTDTRQAERLTGGLFILSLILLVGHLFSLPVLRAIHSIVWVLFYGFGMCLTGVALFRMLEARDRTLASLAAFGIVTHGVVMVVAACLLLAGLRFPAEFSHFGGDETGLEAAMDRTRASAFTFLGIGLLASGVLLARTGMVARWLGAAGAVVGLICILSTLLDLAGVAAGWTPLAVMAALVYMLILGARLVFRPPAPADAGVA